jgi:hypothetical protein
MATRYANAPDQADLTRSVVASYLDQRNITPIFDAPVTWRLTPGFRRRSDTDKQLEWLERQVRPTVDRLREFGKAREAHLALWPDSKALYDETGNAWHPSEHGQTELGDAS